VAAVVLVAAALLVQASAWPARAPLLAPTELSSVVTRVNRPAWAAFPRPLVRPRDVEELEDLAAAHFAHGRLSAAERAARAALELGTAPRARLVLGEIELRRAGGADSAAHLERARAELELARRDPALAPRAHELLAELELAAGRLEGARLYLLAALSAAPERADLRARLGRLYLERGEAREARRELERATELAPELADAWSALCRLAFQEEKLDEAAERAARALALEVDSIEANAVLGRVLEMRGERAAAERHYRRALSIAPDRPDALQIDASHALGALLAADGREEEALRLFERVVALRADPPHVRAHLASARLHLARGDLGAARARVAAVLRSNPSQPDALALRARIEAAASEGTPR
jgi:tetratricopeptide (TPR) repeat protein